MRSPMRTVLATATLLGLLLAVPGLRPARAFEFSGNRIDPALTAVPLEVVIWVKPGVSQADQQRTLDDIRAGLDLWEDIPTSEIAFDIVSVIQSPIDPGYQPGQIHITMGNAGDIASGAATGPDASGNPGRWLGVIANIPTIDTVTVAAHEIGHTLGFSHATITTNYYAQEQCSVMHFNVTEPVMDPDDIAMASTAYPDPAQPLLGATGTIRGRLLVDGTLEPIYGINVVAEDVLSDEPTVSRISGSVDLDGTYEIPGVPPGTYRLRFLDGHSLQGSLPISGAPGLTRAIIQADNFDEFTLENVTVAQGQVLDLGDHWVEIHPMELDGFFLGSVPDPWSPMPITWGVDPYLPSATVNQDYELWLHIAGGLRELDGLISGLPAGLTADVELDPRAHNDSFGVYGTHWLRITGTPTVPGLYTLDIDLEDLLGDTAWAWHNLVVEPLPPQGPVAYYSFEGDAKDHSGNGHHGLQSGGSYVADRHGNPNSALKFDGVNDLVLVPDEAAFDLDEYTLLTILSIPEHHPREWVLSKGQHFGNYTLSIYDDGHPYWAGYATYAHRSLEGNFSAMVSQGPVPHDRFVCLAVTVSREDGVTTYDEGELAWTFGEYSDNAYNDEPLVIGAANPDGHGLQYFRGTIDEVLIYAGALDDHEIADRCADPFPGGEPLSIHLDAGKTECVERGDRVELKLSLRNHDRERPLVDVEYWLQLPEGVRLLETELEARYDEKTRTLYGGVKQLRGGESLGGMVAIEVDEDGFLTPTLVLQADTMAMGGEAAPPRSAQLVIPPCE